MSKAYKHELDGNAVIGASRYLRRLREDLKSKIEELQLEVRALDTAIDRVDAELCPYCKGQQKWWVNTSQDEGRWEYCPECNGEGMGK